MMNYIPEPAFGRGEAPMDGRKLGEMILASAAAAENYRALARCFQGWQATALAVMAREARAQGTCLSGIRAMVTGEESLRPAAPGDTGTPAARLKKAYVRAMQLLTACEALAADREYGPVFRRLAIRQQDHCRKILEIIGSIQ